MRALRPWQAIVAYFVGGGIAQAVGIVLALVVAMASVATSGRLDEGSLLEASRSFPVLAVASLSVGLTLLLISVVAPLLAKVPVREALGLTRPPALAVVAAALGVVGLGPLSEVLVSGMERVAPNLTFGTLDALHEVVLAHPAWVLWPVLALSPGICEEVFFRGAFQRAFGRGKKAIAISAVAFAVFHLDPHHVVGVLPVGLFLAWAAARTGSTWVTIAAHVVNNTAAIVAAKAGGGEPHAPGEIATPWWVPLIGAGIAAASIAVIVRVSRPAPPPATGGAAPQG